MKVIKPIVVSYLFMAILLAQPPRAQAPVPPPARDQGRNRMELMAIWKLTDELRLTEKQAETFFPKMRAHREEMKKLQKAQRELMQPLVDKAERGEEISDKELARAIKEVNKLEAQKIEQRNTFIEGMKGTLTNAQLVKLMVFSERFIQDIRKQFKEHRRPSDRPGPRRSWK